MIKFPSRKYKMRVGKVIRKCGRRMLYNLLLNPYKNHKIANNHRKMTNQ